MNCRFCGAEVEEGAKFCQKCGKNLEEVSDKKNCPKCGSELEKDAKFCLKCGYSMEKKAAGNGKKKLIIGIVALIAVICIGGGIGVVVHQKAVEKERYEQELAAERERQEAERARQELINAYGAKAMELNNAINGTENNFNLLSSMYYTSTGINTGLLGPDFFTDYVEGLCSSEINTEKDRKREIDKIYTELQDIGCDEEEVKELKKAMEDYYYAYCERYSFLVEGDFSVNNFKAKEETSKKDFTDKAAVVKSLIRNVNTLGTTEESEIEEGSTL